MAIAERRLAGEFNRPGHEVIDHRTYVICSDGDLQEGITAEAARLAGHLRLGKLIALYDDNRIQLDGPTAWTFTEDVARALRRVRLAHPARRGRQRRRGDRRRHRGRQGGRPAVADRRPHAHRLRQRPTRQDSQKSHGAPLGPDEVRLTKEAYGWDPDKTFFVPDEAGELFRARRGRGRGRASADWDAALDAYAAAFPAEAAELRRRIAGRPAGRLGRRRSTSTQTGSEVATRNA